MARRERILCQTFRWLCIGPLISIGTYVLITGRKFNGAKIPSLELAIFTCFTFGLAALTWFFFGKSIR